MNNSGGGNVIPALWLVAVGSSAGTNGYWRMDVIHQWNIRSCNICRQKTVSLSRWLSPTSASLQINFIIHQHLFHHNQMTPNVDQLKFWKVKVFRQIIRSRKNGSTTVRYDHVSVYFVTSRMLKIKGGTSVLARAGCNRDAIQWYVMHLPITVWPVFFFLVFHHHQFTLVDWTRLNDPPHPQWPRVASFSLPEVFALGTDSIKLCHPPHK